MSKYTPEQLAAMATMVLGDLESGTGEKAEMLIHILRSITGLSRQAILAKLHGLTVGMPA